MRAHAAFGVVLATGLALSSWAAADDGSSLQFATYVQITSIIANGLIRIAAIAAGVYVVWMGRDTMIRGITGDFKFEGAFGKLKGATPGLLFVLLGSLAVGWALQTTASGELRMDVTAADSGAAQRTHASDKAPSFVPKADGSQ